MANRQSILRESARTAQWVLRRVGQELRVARVLAGMTQRQVAARIGGSASQVSRVEHGLIRGFTLEQLHRHSAVVGLKPYLNLYPSVARPLDRAQLALFARFRGRIGHEWSVRLEVPMPLAGDLRAADAVLAMPGSRIVVEVITRLADFQAQLRSARRKVRDLDADRLVLVVGATETNRRAIRDAGVAVEEAFPFRTKAAMRRLARGEDPGGDSLILL
jgi:transcriptional regulator with XRE-family HTH domain